MEIGNDLLASLRGQLDAPGGTSAGLAFDWAGLRARCAAAHAARQAMQHGLDSSQGQADGAFPSGGFGDWTRVASVSRNHASRVVNRTDLTDGKVPARIDGPVASDAVVGGRG